MKRSLAATVVLSLALAAWLVPTVLAADPGATESTPPADPAPTATPMPTDDGTPPDGVISVDPTFITAAPSGEVLDATGRPDPTLPPTDATTTPATAGGATLQALLIGMTALCLLTLLVGRTPGARRR